MEKTISPLPWSRFNLTIRDATADTIAGVDGVNYKIATANAEFIVTACNSFEAMISALGECRAEISRINSAAGETVFNPAVTQLINSALALSKGK